MDPPNKETVERRVPKVKFKRVRRRPRTKGFRLFLKNEIEKALCAKPSFVDHLFEADENGTLSALFTEVIAVLGLNTEKMHSLSTVAIKSTSNISSLFRIDGSSYEKLRIFRKLADTGQESTVVYVDNLPLNCRVLYILQRASMFGTIVSLRVRFVGEKKERTCYTFLSNITPSVSTAEDLLLSERRVESAFVQFVEAAAAEKFCRVYRRNLPARTVSPIKRRKRSFTKKKKSLQRALAHSSLDTAKAAVAMNSELESAEDVNVGGLKSLKDVNDINNFVQGVGTLFEEDSGSGSEKSKKRRHPSGPICGELKKACVDHCMTLPSGDVLFGHHMQVPGEEGNDRNLDVIPLLVSEGQHADEVVSDIMKEAPDSEISRSVDTTVVEGLSVSSDQLPAGGSEEVVAVKSEFAVLNDGSKKKAAVRDGAFRPSVQISVAYEHTSIVEQGPSSSSIMSREQGGGNPAEAGEEDVDTSEPSLIPVTTQAITGVHRPTTLLMEKAIDHKFAMRSNYVLCCLRRKKKRKRTRRRRKRCKVGTKSRIPHVTRYFSRMQVMPLATFRKLRQDYLALKKQYTANLKKELKNKRIALAIPGKTRRERTRIRGRTKLIARAVASRDQCEGATDLTFGRFSTM